MAIYRNIQMTFWTDSKVVDDFTPEDRYFYLYLLTNPHSNLCGCYEISFKQAASETGYSIDTITNLINRLQNVLQIISYDPKTKELLLLNWYKFNWTTSKDFQKALFREIDTIKNKQFKEYLLSIYEGDETVTRPSLDGRETTVPVSVTVTDTVSVTETDSVTVKNTKKKPKVEKKNYGKFENVLLTEEEYQKLKEAYADYQERIDDLSFYIKSKGKKYKDHYATILTWARRDEKQQISKPQQKNKVAQDLDNFYSMVADWAQEEGDNGG